MNTVLITGLLLGLGSNFHCIGMCGPIALAVPVNRKNNLTILSGVTQYNLGRILTYAILGFIIGSVGITVQSLGILQWASIIVGIAMIVYAWRKYFRALIPSNSTLSIQPFLNASLGKVIKSSSPFKLSFLGMLNGLLPCGMVYAGLLNSLLAGDMISGALAMTAFGIGTLPAMVIVTFMANKISNDHRRKINKLVPYLLTLVGLLIVLRGMNLNIPYISPQVKAPTSQVSDNAELSCCHAKEICD